MSATASTNYIPLDQAVVTTTNAGFLEVSLNAFATGSLVTLFEIVPDLGHKSLIRRLPPARGINPIGVKLSPAQS